ncbi:MAG: tRNA (adenosine(37)-N6)-threonylcarbamoyltransferase complex dimerization subunit type 1 TsaB [Firmicutes bacterium]|nr:tRNA (adenosine(37)-N6)-threonylcarbamoyltransferase complex dimerization subunit type 1 TsaB [Bacillota bacterium]
MLILGLDTSTRVCSVALLNGGELVGEYTQNVSKTHSQRLLPLISCLLDDTGTDRKDLDAVAVAIGPGSFTGLRIGIATARALAQGLGLQAVGVSTLRALAENLSGRRIIVCPMLDARRDQVYAALYRPYAESAGGGSADFETLLAPTALSIHELVARLRPFEDRVCFPGDGQARYLTLLHKEMGNRYTAISPALALNRASSVAVCAARKMKAFPGQYSYFDLRPEYLRVPEAERRRREKDT